MFSRLPRRTVAIGQRRGVRETERSVWTLQVVEVLLNCVGGAIGWQLPASLTLACYMYIVGVDGQ